MTGQRALFALVVALLVVVSGCAGSGMTDSSIESETTSSTTTASTHTATESTSTANGTVDVHYINVGQSASTLIVTPQNETILIDTGDWRNDGEYVLEYLKQQNITRIDHLVTSHSDADHIGGHAAVIGYYETQADGVGAVYDPGLSSSSQTYEEYLDAVETHNVPLYQVASDDTLPVAGVNVAVLAPPEEPLAGGQRNENSIALMVTHGEQRFLFTGDAESEGERYLVDKYGSQLNATVFQAGHHGSQSSSSDALLEASSPHLTVISSAYDSQYGHPHSETLTRFADRSIPAYWTAVHGNVVISSDGENLTVSTQRNATTNPTELRSADPIEPGSDDPIVERITLAGGISNPEPIVTDGGTETSTPTETPSESTDAALALIDVHADAEGNDNENLNDEYLVFENTGDEPLDMSGWTIEDEAGHTYTVPSGFTLEPGTQVTLYTGSGTDTDTELYWESSSAIWNNGGDTVIVTDDAGTVVVEESYE
ncbi:lamin tail domain-containing protein [Haloprofundus halophilus]|uniref:lamin tail domain-containing protein n=1 Tax=Haloprofundus halophilus TaxID=2283527 RepID=UPI000E44E121|nr:lamin tail domain-containing protein [Haloprofundus halophilus]